MSGFQDLVGSGADCSTGNSLTQFSKQLQQDRSLQQDRFGFNDARGGSSMALRDRPGVQQDTGAEDMLHEFYQDQRHRPGGHPQDVDMFNMSSLGKELEGIPQGHMMHKGEIPGNVDWAADFARQSAAGRTELQDFTDFEALYQQHRAAPVGAPAEWAREFQMHHHTNVQLPQHQHREFESAFEKAKQEINWEAEFAKASDPAAWAKEFTKPESESWIEEFSAAQNRLNADGATSKEALAKTAGMLLEAVETSSNPKFRESKFMDFMKKLRDQEVSIEGNKVVEQIEPIGGPLESAEAWAKHFGASVKGNNWEEEFDNLQNPQNGMERGTDWAGEFSQQQRPPQDWAQEFSGATASSSNHVAERDWAKELFAQQSSNRTDEDWAASFAKTVADDSYAHDMDDFESAFKNAWDYDKQEKRAMGMRYEDYEFTPNNPYLQRPIPDTYRNLTEGILALEASVQQDPENASKWFDLGMRQQENENDVAAIAALRHAVRTDPSLTDAWLALAVSYTNESYRDDAYDALESWVMHNERYKQIVERQKPGWTPVGVRNEEPKTGQARHDQVMDYFLEAARQGGGEDLDAEVQVGLGVLLNISGEYSKAVDCFEAALSKRPEDYMLWNKLGATLANANNSTRAIDAYFHALDINPSFVRARYNLAISCIHMGQYNEASEHLLGALDVQSENLSSVMQEAGVGNDGELLASVHGVQSSSVWSTLQMVTDVHLGRPDLSEACKHRDLAAFRKDFQF